MSSPLSYNMFMDQDIFSFVDPNDLQHIYREDMNAQPQQEWMESTDNQERDELRRSRDRAASLPILPQTQLFPFFPTVVPQSSPKRRASFSEKCQPIPLQFPEYPESPSYDEEKMEVFFDNANNQNVSNQEVEMEQTFSMDTSDMQEEPADSVSSNFKLQSSKSPVIDALVYCALMKHGISLIEDSPKLVQFRIHDFPQYYQKSKGICSKAHPTDDLNSRVKALQRWFPDFPTLKELHRGQPCTISLCRTKNHSNFIKLQVILERQKLQIKFSQSNPQDSSLAHNKAGTLMKGRRNSQR